MIDSVTTLHRSVKKEFDERKEPPQKGGSYRQPSSGKHPDDGDDECGKEVGDAHVRQAEEVRADAEDQDVADGTEALEGGGRHDGLEEACGQEDGTLKDADGQGREDTALAERRRHDHDDDGIEDRLGEEHGRIAEQAVVDGADDGHRADADGQ